MWSTKFDLEFEGIKRVRFSSPIVEGKSIRRADQEDGLTE